LPFSADAATVCSVNTPTVTEGPYWVDEKLFRSDIRTDPATGVVRQGIPLALTINVVNSNANCAALAGAYVDIWHCDAIGIYSDESTYNPGGGTGAVSTTGQKFLRGYQITDANGHVQFTTIYPGWYSGRTIHIHVRIRTFNGQTHAHKLHDANLLRRYDQQHSISELRLQEVHRPGHSERQ
jgi:protocatechuate 3,4-dioxygenase beta subunit